MNENEVDITGLDKATVLAALYNASKPIGLGRLQYRPEDMTREQAQALLDANEDKDKWFDYIQGRVLKVRLSSNILRTGLYNRDNGNSAAERVIEKVRVRA